MRVKRQILLCAGICAVVICANTDNAFASRNNNRRGSAESDAILPQIDVIRVKESADEALRNVDELRRENERLNALIVELDNRIIVLSEEIARGVSPAKIEELETRIALLTEAYKDMHLRLHAIEIAIRPTPPPPTPAPTTPPMFTTSASGVIVASPEYELYQRALRLFNARSYERALEAFTECVTRFPDGQFRDRARFWIGESQFQLGNFERAIEDYRLVLGFTNSSKADAAQFQIALSHQRLGQTERARAEFRRLIERYPASEYVERARRFVNELR